MAENDMECGDEPALSEAEGAPLSPARPVALYSQTPVVKGPTGR
jgi:hypothetical protein